MPPLEVEDEDVARERIRVEQDATDELRLIELTKVSGVQTLQYSSILKFYFMSDVPERKRASN